MRPPLLVLCLFTFLSSLGAAADPAPVSLFDGQTLSGWEGDEKVFRVEEGVIVAGTLKARIARNEFLATKQEYGDFDLSLEAKLLGEGRNAGVQFRSQRIPDHHEVKGYQCDMGVMSDRNIWGWLYDESRRRMFLAESIDEQAVAKVFKSGEWNHLRIRCKGPRVRIWVNQVLTVDYREQQADIARKGIIALQIHSGQPSEASYRRIKIVELGGQ